MANAPPPPTHVPVLTDDGRFTLPWWRYLTQNVGKSNLGPQGPAGPAGPAGASGSADSGVQALALLAEAMALEPNPGITALELLAVARLDTQISAGTGITLTPSPITDNGIVALTVPVAVANGGTGQTSFTDGQLLIGDSSTGGLDKATLTAGVNITITNSHGGITIASSAGASTNANWFPLTSGTEPPNWITNGAGVPIAVYYTP